MVNRFTRPNSPIWHKTVGLSGVDRDEKSGGGLSLERLQLKTFSKFAAKCHTSGNREMGAQVPGLR